MQSTLDSAGRFGAKKERRNAIGLSVSRAAPIHCSVRLVAITDGDVVQASKNLTAAIADVRWLAAAASSRRYRHMTAREEILAV
jgi:hypothetical protein